MSNRIARGRMQSLWYNDLSHGYVVTNPVASLRGKAKTYSPRYYRSFINLLDRMRENGYHIVRCPGIRGGEYSACYAAYVLDNNT